ncbi:MAG: hypothetical protein WBD71_12340 [Xanthobacteraceae bacterium]
MKLDAVTVLTVMGMAAKRLGLGATYSTSYYEPRRRWPISSSNGSPRRPATALCFLPVPDVGAWRRRTDAPVR